MTDLEPFAIDVSVSAARGGLVATGRNLRDRAVSLSLVAGESRNRPA